MCSQAGAFLIVFIDLANEWFSTMYSSFYFHFVFMERSFHVLHKVAILYMWLRERRYKQLLIRWWKMDISTRRQLWVALSCGLDLVKSKWDHWPEESRETMLRSKNSQASCFLVCSTSASQICFDGVKSIVTFNDDTSPWCCLQTSEEKTKVPPSHRENCHARQLERGGTCTFLSLLTVARRLCLIPVSASSHPGARKHTS